MDPVTVSRHPIEHLGFDAYAHRQKGRSELPGIEISPPVQNIRSLKQFQNPSHDMSNGCPNADFSPTPHADRQTTVVPSQLNDTLRSQAPTALISEISEMASGGAATKRVRVRNPTVKRSTTKKPSTKEAVIEKFATEESSTENVRTEKPSTGAKDSNYVPLYRSYRGDTRNIIRKFSVSPGGSQGTPFKYGKDDNESKYDEKPVVQDFSIYAARDPPGWVPPMSDSFSLCGRKGSDASVPEVSFDYGPNGQNSASDYSFNYNAFYEEHIPCLPQTENNGNTSPREINFSDWLKDGDKLYTSDHDYQGSNSIIINRIFPVTPFSSAVIQNAAKESRESRPVKSVLSRRGRAIAARNFGIDQLEGNWTEDGNWIDHNGYLWTPPMMQATFDAVDKQLAIEAAQKQLAIEARLVMEATERQLAIEAAERKLAMKAQLAIERRLAVKAQLDKEAAQSQLFYDGAEEAYRKKKLRNENKPKRLRRR